MNRLARLYWTVRALGWENVPRRAWHALEGRLGVARRRLPGGELSATDFEREFQGEYQPQEAHRWWKERAKRFFIGPERVQQFRSDLGSIVDDRTWQATVEEDVRRLPQGELRFFSHRFERMGWPVQFDRDPIHGVDWPVGQHWTRYRQFDPARADLKCVWEASRFSVAYPLARDHVRRPDSPAAALFWQLLADWDAQNPYGLSAPWACSQESTFRLMAWLFAACATLDSAAVDTRRLHRLTQLVWYTARHIEGNIIYARGQKNNHAISEAVGMWTVGVLFPEFRRAAHWANTGKRILREEIARQLYDDGSYVQHSVNYHRLMLDDILWAVCLARHAGETLDLDEQRISRAIDWLHAMTDPETGRAPNYGNNDGASVLPLSCSDYLDFRPTVQAAFVAFRGTRAFQSGPWDEKALWLCGPQAVGDGKAQGSTASVASKRLSLNATTGGYFASAGPNSWGMIRIHTYRDRPHQADMLHLDLWHRGQNVVGDGGSYHYYSPAPWPHYFESTAAHNTVEIDSQDQMQKGPRFLWFRWVQARVLAQATSVDGRAFFIAGEHEGYRSLAGGPIHRRSVLRIDDTWIIVDDILGSEQHRVALRWRLAPVEWSSGEQTSESGCACSAWQGEVAGEKLAIRLARPDGLAARLTSGEEGPHPEGWESRYYASKEAAPTIVVAGDAALPVRLTSIIGPAADVARIKIAPACTSGEALRIAGLDAAAARHAEQVSGGRMIAWP